MDQFFLADWLLDHYMYYVLWSVSNVFVFLERTFS